MKKAIFGHLMVLVIIAIGLTSCATAEKYRARGWDFYQSRDNVNALQEYNKAIEMDPSNANLFFQRGHVHRAMRNNALALSDYQKALEINPKSSNILAFIGEIYFDTADHDTALNYYNQSLAINSKNEVAIAGIRKIESARAETQRAEERRQADLARQEQQRVEQDRLARLFNSSPTTFGNLQGSTWRVRERAPIGSAILTSTIDFGAGSFRRVDNPDDMLGRNIITGEYRVQGNEIIFKVDGTYSVGNMVGNSFTAPMDLLGMMTLTVTFRRTI
jgi:Flp pilus assembly protein TadD